MAEEQPKKMPMLSENGEGSSAPAQPTPLESERLPSIVIPDEWRQFKITAFVDKSIRCATCPALLKPPVFKCQSCEHVVCSDCGDGGGSKHCGPCGRDSIYVHYGDIEGVLELMALPQCPYCGMSVDHHAMAAHTASCAHAPSAH